MPSLIQRSFAAGEIAPSLAGRADHVKYQTGLRTCRNFIVMRHGGVSNRAGSQFIAEVKTSSVQTYLGKFVFNADQTYIIEAGNGYFRFYREGAQIVVSAVSAWSAITAYVPGDLVVSGGINYYCFAANTNQVPPNGVYWFALAGVIYEIPTPYAAADLPTLKYFQDADVIMLTHRNYPPQQLSRFGHTRWTLAAFSTVPAIAAPTGLTPVAGTGSSLAYSYIVTAVAAVTYEESLGSAAAPVSCDPPTAALPNTLSWTAVPGAVEYDVYCSQVGAAFGFIGVASTNSYQDVGYIPDKSSTPPVARVLFAAPGDYPQTGIFFQQRLVMGGSATNPMQADASQIGYLTNFSIHSPIEDDDALSFKVKSKLVNELRYFEEAGGKLIMLTSSGEWTLEGDTDGVLKPTAINPKQHGQNGVAQVPPVVIGDTVIYVQARGQIVRNLQFDFTTQSYSSKDLTLFSPHLFDGLTIERMDFAQIPQSVCWFIRNDGVLIGLTYVPEQDVWGWHHHDTGDGDLYEEVCTIPEFDEDATYVIVNRQIQGVTKRYIERFPRRWGQDLSTNAYFSDSWSVYSGAPVISVSGLSYLEGRTVTILADGNVLAQQTVVSGTVTLGREYSVIYVGLPITADFETLDMDVQGAQIRDRKKLITSISLLIDDSRSVSAGPDADHLDDYQGDPAVAYGTPPALTSGVIEIPITSTWESSGRFFVRHTDPLPLTILAAIPHGDIGG